MLAYIMSKRDRNRLENVVLTSNAQKNTRAKQMLLFMPSYTLWLTSGGNEPPYLERALHLVPIYFCPFA